MLRILLPVFIALTIVIAIILSVLVFLSSSTNYIPRDTIVRLLMFRDFFDISLPILLFGALIKYLCSNKANGCCCCQCTKKG